MTSKSERLAAGTILLHARQLRSAIAEDVDATIASTAASLHKTRHGEPLRRAAVLAAIVVASRSLSAAVAPDIVASRHGVRAASLTRLGAEFAAAGIVVSQFALSAAGTEEDHTRADIAADGLALGWRSVAMAALIHGDRKGIEPSKAIEQTRSLMKPRIARTAATEIDSAYNAERLTVLRDTVEHNRRFAAELETARVMRQWSALADACPKCTPFDGQLARIDGDFPGGYEPGDVHVHCQCSWFVVSASEREYAEAA